MRRVPEVAIRGADIVTLEVQCQDLIRRPSAQLAPVNVVDLVALYEHPEPPPALRASLDDFAGRFRREIADVPNGRSWLEWLDEMAEVPGGRVPATVRGWLAEEAQRPERAPERVGSLLSRWEGEPPVPFELGTGRVRVQKGPKVPLVPTRAQRPEAGPRKPRVAAPRPPRPALRSDADPERVDAIRQTALDRLGDVGDAGLAESVLVAGIRFRLKERFPAMPPQEVFGVLKELVTQGRVRQSAGRYRRSGRW